MDPKPSWTECRGKIQIKSKPNLYTRPSQVPCGHLFPLIQQIFILYQVPGICIDKRSAQCIQMQCKFPNQFVFEELEMRICSVNSPSKNKLRAPLSKQPKYFLKLWKLVSNLWCSIKHGVRYLCELLVDKPPLCWLTRHPISPHSSHTWQFLRKRGK